MRTFLVFVLLLLAAVSVGAATGASADQAGSILAAVLTAGIPLIGTIIWLVSKGKAPGAVVSKALLLPFRDRNTIDKAIEQLLTTVGVPPLVADKVGDIVSGLVVSGTEITSVKEFWNVVRRILTEQLASVSTNQLKVSTKGLIPEEILQRPEGKSVVAIALASHKATEELGTSVISKALGKPAQQA